MPPTRTPRPREKVGVIGKVCQARAEGTTPYDGVFVNNRIVIFIRYGTSDSAMLISWNEIYWLVWVWVFCSSGLLGEEEWIIYLSVLESFKPPHISGFSFPLLV